MDDVRSFYDRYAATLDDGKLDNWPDFFTEQCLYRIVSRENIERNLPLSTLLCEGQGMLHDRVAGIRQTMMYAPRYYRRFISSVLVENQHSADSITARANFLVIETLVDEPSRVAFCGVSRDKLRLMDTRWRFAERVCILDTEMLPNSLIYPL